MSMQYILIVDRESQRRDSLEKSIKSVLESTGADEFSVVTISGTEEAARFAGKNDAPIVFIGGGISEASAVGMLRRIREERARTNFIFVTDDKEYIARVLRLKLRLSGCITEQPDEENVRDQLENLWFPLDEWDD